MFASDWIIGLFSNVMPLSIISKFYSLFFKEGWLALYKVVLVLLHRFQKQLIQNRETGDILIQLKSNPSFQTNFATGKNKKTNEGFWESVVSKVEKGEHEAIKEVSDELIDKLKSKVRIK
mmetsp:Transcript_949/g.958  ORF Transcript_949/g.958 Transcript_949/m.958 type:complete len:120 (+) Transcript_949:183-542(+)